MSEVVLVDLENVADRRDGGLRGAYHGSMRWSLEGPICGFPLSGKFHLKKGRKVLFMKS